MKWSVNLQNKKSLGWVRQSFTQADPAQMKGGEDAAAAAHTDDNEGDGADILSPLSGC